LWRKIALLLDLPAPPPFQEFDIDLFESTLRNALSDIDWIDLTNTQIGAFADALEAAGYVLANIPDLADWIRSIEDLNPTLSNEMLMGVLADALLRYFNLDIEHLAAGGRILSEGVAYLHAGEVVVPAAQVAALGSGSGMVIDNTIMLDGNVLYQGMQRVNRQQEMRRTGSSVGTRAWRNA